MRILWVLLAVLLPTAAQAASGMLGGLAIGGYDPVITLGQNRAVKGFPGYLASSDFMVYTFHSQQNLDLFLADKEKYTPQFGGNCAYQAAMGRIVAADPEVWAIERGRLYFFRNTDSRDAWYSRARNYIAAATATWATYKGQPVPQPTEPQQPPESSLVPINIDSLSQNPIVSLPLQGEKHVRTLRRKGHRIQP